MKKQTRKAQLVYWEKLTLESGLLREGVIWRVPKGIQYPEGIKYRLVLAIPAERKILVLFDNHYPKGHHQHFPDGQELTYHFLSVEGLIRDYEKSIDQAETIHKNKKNPHKI